MTIPASVAWRWLRALAAAPVGAFGPALRPLAPLRPGAVHCRHSLGSAPCCHPPSLPRGWQRRTHRGIVGQDVWWGQGLQWAQWGVQHRHDGAVAVPRAGQVPGQRVVQAVFCTFWPSQKAPPLRGVGLVHVRLRFCQPRPQLVLQPDHCVHVDQPPFTGWRGTHQHPATKGMQGGTGQGE